MRTSKFVYFLLIAAAAQAHAGAGQTSAGVTTTVPNDPTAATQDVQSQSSNFVQANQALAGGTAGTLANAGTTRNGQNSNGTDPNNPGRPGDPNAPSTDPKAAANVAPAAPAVPPPPPPEYVSNVKKVDRNATVAAVIPPAVPDKTASTAPKTAAPAEVNSSAVTAPGAQRQAAIAQKPLARAADPATRTGAERVAAGVGSSGGSGEPPDSYAFYVGLIIAGALLAFAAAMFLRVEKGGAR